MKTMKLICMSFDGDFITDSVHENKEHALNACENLGSKWYFYPFTFITSGTKVIETGSGLVRMSDKKAYSELMFKGRNIHTVKNVFKKLSDYCTENDLSYDSLEYESLMIEHNRNLIRS